MKNPNVLPLLPPLLTIALAIATREIIFSLALGAFSGCLILTDFHPLLALLKLVEEEIFVVIAKPSNAEVRLAMGGIGGFVKMREASGGARAFAKKITTWISNPLRAQLAAWVCGLMMQAIAP